MSTQPNLRAERIDGDMSLSGSMYATTITGSTFYSGGTPLTTIITNIAIANAGSGSTGSGATTYVQSGLNIYTGGTATAPTINLSAATLVSLSAATISGATLYSGTTNLYSIFAQTGATFLPPSLVALGSATSGITYATNLGFVAGGGTNVFTVGSAPVLSLNTNGIIVFGSTTLFNAATSCTAGLSINGVEKVSVAPTLVSVSTTAAFASGITAQSVKATNLSGGTLYSGSTNLYSIFSTTNTITSVQGGLNTYTGGTATVPTINISAATLSSLSSVTVSAGTFYSGSTPLSTVISTLIGNSTAVQAGTNITTGGTQLVPTINLAASPSVNSFTSSGTSQLSTATAVTFSGGTVSGGTLYSGSTNLYSIFTTVGTTNYPVISGGTNIVTGGTQQFPVISTTQTPTFGQLTTTDAANQSTMIVVSAATLSASSTFLHSLNGTISTASTNYNVGVIDYIILASGLGTTVTLPSAAVSPSRPMRGRMYIIKNIDPVNAITVATTGAEKIDSAGTYPLPAFNSLTVVADGIGTYYII